MRIRPARLSHELRRGTGGSLTQRRVVAGLGVVAVGAMSVITLYQLGIVKHLPEPPLPRLDADRVDASAEAYSHLQAPDAALGIGNYAATVALAAMGGRDRARDRPWLPVALAAKSLFDGYQAVRLMRDQTEKFHAYCFWSLLTGISSLVALPFALSEARMALRARA